MRCKMCHGVSHKYSDGIYRCDDCRHSEEGEG